MQWMHDISHTSLFNFGWSAEEVGGARWAWLLPPITRMSVGKLIPSAPVMKGSNCAACVLVPTTTSVFLAAKGIRVP